MEKLIRQIEDGIVSCGGKRSRSRSLVIEHFFRHGRHVTVDELTRIVRDAAPGIGTVTVYRTMKLLSRLGYANELDFGEGVTRYESSFSSHHDHLICKVCGTVTEFSNPNIEELQSEVARRHRFKPTSHRLDIYGVCGKCGGKASDRGAKA